MNCQGSDGQRERQKTLVRSRAALFFFFFLAHRLGLPAAKKRNICEQSAGLLGDGSRNRRGPNRPARTCGGQQFASLKTAIQSGPHRANAFKPRTPNGAQPAACGKLRIPQAGNFWRKRNGGGVEQGVKRRKIARARPEAAPHAIAHAPSVGHQGRDVVQVQALDQAGQVVGRLSPDNTRIEVRALSLSRRPIDRTSDDR